MEKKSLIQRALKSIDQDLEDRFLKWARSPRLLALMARSVNANSTLRIELTKMQSEISSFKARIR